VHVQSSAVQAGGGGVQVCDVSGLGVTTPMQSVVTMQVRV
jgi:hypothetical protein